MPSPCRRDAADRLVRDRLADCLASSRFAKKKRKNSVAGASRLRIDNPVMHWRILRQF